MSSRRKARILAFQALYAWEASSTPVQEILLFPWLDSAKLECLDEESATFTKLIVAGAIENIQAIDAEITAHLSHWPFERLKKVDLAILRMGAYCLLFQKDIPAQITIDEGIEIAKEYGTEESYKFINGVLDGIHRDSDGSKKPVSGEASSGSFGQTTEGGPH
ncbi:MAG: transcription antitermination factor NusB [Spirochaetes bacterium]|nr:transcription antitermination factor NusB [Spirochaetota bacterium]